MASYRSSAPQEPSLGLDHSLTQSTRSTMTDLPITQAAPKPIHAKASESDGKIKSLVRWFWRVTEETKEMNTKPYKGVL